MSFDETKLINAFKSNLSHKKAKSSGIKISQTYYNIFKKIYFNKPLTENQLKTFDKLINIEKYKNLIHISKSWQQNIKYAIEQNYGYSKVDVPIRKAYYLTLKKYWNCGQIPTKPQQRAFKELSKSKLYKNLMAWADRCGVMGKGKVILTLSYISESDEDEVINKSVITEVYSEIVTDIKVFSKTYNFNKKKSTDICIKISNDFINAYSLAIDKVLEKSNLPFRNAIIDAIRIDYDEEFKVKRNIIIKQNVVQILDASFVIENTRYGRTSHYEYSDILHHKFIEDLFNKGYIVI